MVLENKNKYKNGYTKIPNCVLGNSEIPYKARFLYCLLLMHGYGKGECFPSESLLAKEMNKCDRYVRDILKIIVRFKLIEKIFRGHKGKSNRYILPDFNPNQRNCSSPLTNNRSDHRGNSVPINIGTIIPTNNNQLIIKNNNNLNYRESDGYKKYLEARNKLSNKVDY